LLTRADQEGGSGGLGGSLKGPFPKLLTEGPEREAERWVSMCVSAPR